MLPDACHSFLSSHGWDDARITPLSTDWSPRRFFRLSKAGQGAMLLLYAQDRAYPGHEYDQTIIITDYMRRAGLPVPAILARDDAQGVLLVEDFGDRTIHDNAQAYDKAVDLAVQMAGIDVTDWPLIAYQDGHVYKALQYFMRYSCNCPQAVDEWMAAWDQLMQDLIDWPHVLTHMDYHAGNLLIRSDETLGMIDHQGARLAPLGYDLVNLIEDARIDVPVAVKQHHRQRFLDGFPAVKDRFDAVFDLLCLQFHMRVYGQIDYLSREKGRDDLAVYSAALRRRILFRLDKPYAGAIKMIVKATNPDFL